MKKSLMTISLLAISAFGGSETIITCNGLTSEKTGGKTLDASINFTGDNHIKYKDSFGNRTDIDLKKLTDLRDAYGYSYDEVDITDSRIYFEHQYKHAKRADWDTGYSGTIVVEINRRDGIVKIWSASEENGVERGVKAKFTGTCTKRVEEYQNAI